MYHQNGWTALHWAADGGHTEIVKLLLDRGADADTTNQVSNIRLHRQITTMCVNHHTAIISPFIADLCSIKITFTVMIITIIAAVNDMMIITVIVVILITMIIDADNVTVYCYYHYCYYYYCWC